MNYLRYEDYLNYLIFFQVRREKGIPEKDWAEKRAAIADEIEDLGEGYRDALGDGWVKYLSAAYPPGSKRHHLVWGQSRLRCWLRMMMSNQSTGRAPIRTFESGASGGQ